MSRRPFAFLALVFLLVALPVAAVAPAAAHSDLVSSNPAAGAQLAAAPTSVELVFNEVIADAGLQVVAQGPTGSIPLGEPTVSGATVTADWPSEVAAAGEYQLAYRVVSADGHPIDGSVSFSVTRGSGTETTDSRDQGATSAPSPIESAATADPLTSVAGTPESGTSGTQLWVPALIVVVGVAIGAGVAYWLRSRRADA